VKNAGDTESLVELDKFCQSAVCTRPTELYEISVHQWTNLLQLRQNQTYTMMLRRKLQLRMTSRLSRPGAPQLPLFNALLTRVAQLIQEAENEARQVGLLMLLGQPHHNHLGPPLSIVFV